MSEEIFRDFIADLGGNLLQRLAACTALKHHKDLLGGLAMEALAPLKNSLRSTDISDMLQGLASCIQLKHLEVS